MSDPNPTIYECKPSPPTKRVEKDGYGANFYPGFVRRLAVRDAKGQETELYRQPEGDPFCLPPGMDQPWPSSTLEFSRPDGRRLALLIEDPHRQIDRILVFLKAADAPPARRDDAGDALQAAAREGGDPPPLPEGDDLVLICEDGPVLCPPMCPG